MADLLEGLKAKETLQGLLHVGHKNDYKYGDGLSGHYQDGSRWVA